MDSSQFDQLARGLAGSSTRRGALGLLAGLVAATGWEIDPASARKRKRKNRRKGKGKKDQGGGAKPQGSVCERAGSRTCDLSQPRAGVNWEQCNLADAGLVGASLAGMLAEGASFAGAHLLGADLSGAHIDDACFSNANLRGANLRGVIARNTALDGADLCGADLRGTNLTAKQIAEASVCCATRLPNGKSAAPCPTGRECCGVACTDLQFDRGNCGACGNICTGGDICCNGDCVAPHPEGLCGLGGPACIDSSQDLQQVFDAASDGQTIYLCAGTWYLLDTLLINKNLSIFGPTGGGSILTGTSGEEATQVLGIRPNINVAIGNVEFTRGKADEGAGIFNQGSLALYDCKVTENEATFGGGIYNEGNLYLYNTTVAQNAVKKSSSVFDPEYNGGGIYNDEGTVVLYGGTVLTGNAANDHTQDFGFGGGLFNNYGHVTLKSDVQLTNNHAATHGGGLYNRFGTMTSEAGSTVTDNVSGTGSGGGLYDEFDCCSVHLITIANTSVITGNTPNNCAGDSAQITNCMG
jgi:hypothetical protein